MFRRLNKDEYVKCRKVNTEMLRKSRETNTLDSIESMKERTS